jgi:hypothetical protein
MTKTMSRMRKTKSEGERVCVDSPLTTARAPTKAVMKWEMKTHTHFRPRGGISPGISPRIDIDELLSGLGMRHMHR